jgi:hypothetical protein
MDTNTKVVAILGGAVLITIVFAGINWLFIRSALQCPQCNCEGSTPVVQQTSAKTVSYIDPGYAQRVRSDPMNPVSYIEAHPSSL